MPPAARVTDMHTCPMVTVLVPHVGGPILPPGAPTVLIGFLPAARVTDMLVCVGPPDMIAKGSAGVFINFLPAARMGDITAHGGVIILGEPTVMVGEIGAPSPGAGGMGGVAAGLAMAGLSTPINPNASAYGKGGAAAPGSGYKNIVIKGSAAFRKKTLADLAKLEKTKTGKLILDTIANGGHTVTISELDMATAQKNGGLTKATDPPKAKDGTGSDSSVRYNPDLKKQVTLDDGSKADVPPEDILGHELIHAAHNGDGSNLRDVPNPNGGNMEEARTTGRDPYQNDPMTENKLLDDLGAGFQRADNGFTKN